LLGVYSKEFVAHNKQYYEEAINNGRITVNEKKVSSDYRLKENDKIVHTIDRKEPPVLDLPIEVLLENNDMIVVDKPPSMPVHEVGNYKFNTLVGIL